MRLASLPASFACSFTLHARRIICILLPEAVTSETGIVSSFSSAYISFSSSALLAFHFLFHFPSASRRPRLTPSSHHHGSPGRKPKRSPPKSWIIIWLCPGSADRPLTNARTRAITKRATQHEGSGGSRPFPVCGLVPGLASMACGPPPRLVEGDKKKEKKEKVRIIRTITRGIEGERISARRLNNWIILYAAPFLGNTKYIQLERQIAA